MAEIIYELDRGSDNRPVVVAPLSEHRRTRWYRTCDHEQPDLKELVRIGTLARDTEVGHSPDPGGRGGHALDTLQQAGVSSFEVPDELPGIHIGMESETRTVRLFDPLGDVPELRSVLAIFVAAYRRHLRVDSETVLRGLSPKDFEHWRSWTAAAIERGEARLISPLPIAPVAVNDERIADEPKRHRQPKQEKAAKESRRSQWWRP